MMKQWNLSTAVEFAIGNFAIRVGLVWTALQTGAEEGISFMEPHGFHMLFIWFPYGFHMVSYGFHMVSYDFHMVFICFHLGFIWFNMVLHVLNIYKKIPNLIKKSSYMASKIHQNWCQIRLFGGFSYDVRGAKNE